MWIDLSKQWFARELSCKLWHEVLWYAVQVSLTIDFNKKESNTQFTVTVLMKKQTIAISLKEVI